MDAIQLLTADHDEEETEMFPDLRTKTSQERLDELGAEMAAAK